MYRGSDISGVPRVMGVYSLVRKIPKAKTTEWIYTGMSGGLRNRVAEHLTEQTGTYSGNKNAASLNLERLTHVRWWDCSNLKWPSDVSPEYTDKQGNRKRAEKGNKQWVTAIAGGAEIIIKNRFPPMLDDQANPKGLAFQVAKSPEFIANVEEILENYSQIELPSPEMLHRRIKELEERIRILEDRMDRIDKS